MLAINTITTVISLMILGICLIFVPKLKHDKILFLILSSTIIFNMLGVEWLYKALEQYTYITIRSLIFKTVALLLTFVLIHGEKDYIKYGILSIFSLSASNILNFIHILRNFKLVPLKHLQLKRHVIPVFVFFSMSCAVTIYTNLDIVMLGFLKGDIEVGYYNAAIKIKMVLVSLVTSLGTILLPRSSYYVRKGMTENLYILFNKAIEFIFICALPLMLYFTLFAEESIILLSGQSYIKSIMPMQILMPTVLLIGLSNITGLQMLVALGKEKNVLLSEILGAIADFLINILFIPKLSSAGAAFSTVIAELIVFLVQYSSIRSDFKNALKRIPLKNISKVLFICVMVSLLVKTIQINEFVKLMISAFIFGGLYISGMFVIKEPLVIEVYKQFINRIRNSSVAHK